MKNYEFLAARLTLKMSQSQIAKVLKYSGPGIISRWETGANPVPPQAALLMQALLAGWRPHL